jgi:DNA polymerase-3 subunit delta'
MIYPWQQSQWSQVTRLKTSKHLPHAMLLYGNQGLGKADFARALAESLLCQSPTDDSQACGHCHSCQLLAAGTHPDIHLIEPTPPENSKSKNPVLNIRIDPIRSLCEKINQTSQFSGYRIAILDEADKLTISAANSLLKTLEEPGQNVLMLLVTSRTHRLPVTIRSRCQSIRFTKPDEAQALQWLQDNQQAQKIQAQEHQASREQLQLALRYAHGSPLAAFSYLQDEEHHKVLAEAMTASVTGKSSLSYAAELAKYAKTKTLEGMLIWTSDLSKMLTCGPESRIVNEPYRSKLQAMAQRVNQQRLFRFHDQLNFNLQHNSIAVNEQLLWENLLLSWENL